MPTEISFQNILEIFRTVRIGSFTHSNSCFWNVILAGCTFCNLAYSGLSQLSDELRLSVERQCKACNARFHIRRENQFQEFFKCFYSELNVHI